MTERYVVQAIVELPRTYKSEEVAKNKAARVKAELEEKYSKEGVHVEMHVWTVEV